MSKVMLKRPTANDRKMVEEGSFEMRVFLMMNGPPPENKNTRNFSRLL